MGFDASADKFDELAAAFTNDARANGDGGRDSALPVLVASEDSARGLHLDGVDAVLVRARPSTVPRGGGHSTSPGALGTRAPRVSYREVAASVAFR